jgi:hypothetical protein
MVKKLSDLEFIKDRLLHFRNIRNIASYKKPNLKLQYNYKNQLFRSNYDELREY